MSDRRMLALIVSLCWLGGPAAAATLTITPDKSTYTVGELITLDVFGDSEGEAMVAPRGTLLFDAALAEWVSSEQQPLTTSGIEWTLGNLTSGEGFADAFDQLLSEEPETIDNHLVATVVLRAGSPGTLSYAWQVGPGPGKELRWGAPDEPLDAPGGNVTIIPEPATAALLSFGLIGMTAARRPRRES
jgi:hypothetical protein